jgi:hypothetical protein
MAQFLSIIFLLDLFNFCWVFQKFPFFSFLPVLTLKDHTGSIYMKIQIVPRSKHAVSQL